jgi:hypothetical protein
MRILWRTLPGLAWPTAVGLGLAYLATGFLPRPQPVLVPPEELRAHGLGYGEESPVRAILERNVLHLESPPFVPPGSPLPPPSDPAAALAAITLPPLAPAGAPGARDTAGALVPGGKPGGAMAALSNGGEAGTAAELPADITAMRLLGAVPGGARPMAVVQVEGRAYALHVGERARGWTLLEVRPGQALLGQADRSQWLGSGHHAVGAP